MLYLDGREVVLQDLEAYAEGARGSRVLGPVNELKVNDVPGMKRERNLRRRERAPKIVVRGRHDLFDLPDQRLRLRTVRPRRIVGRDTARARRALTQVQFHEHVLHRPRREPRAKRHVYRSSVLVDLDGGPKRDGY